MTRPSKELICQAQTGFLPERFIGDNGLFLQLLQTHASFSSAHDIGLMLDQEKAYDRVHPEYLTKVLLRFGFPETLVQTIINLFFGSKIQINVNGFLTTEFTQGRGLRQGDPLSPLLFNLAFDPFLRSILQEPSFEGFVFSPPTPNPYCVLPPAPVKALAYADDVLVFLQSPPDFPCLRQLYNTYAAASNARLNISKTEAFSLSGRSSLQWQEFLQEQGFVFSSSNSQRDQYLGSLVQKIQNACNIHSQRQLSYRGRVTVLNSLIYSKLWYVLRLLPVPIKVLDKITSIGYQFVTKGLFPKIRREFLRVPRSLGGLKLLDPRRQQLVLQWKWLRPLLDPQGEPPISPVIQYLTFSIQSVFAAVDPLLPLFMPSCRKGSFGDQRMTVFTLFFKTMDSLSKSLRDISLTPSTCLELPLSDVYQYDPQTSSDAGRVSVIPVPHAHKPWSKVKVSSAYVFDHRSGRLRRRRGQEISEYTGLVKRIFLALLFTIIK
ncbi:hypothetical protein G6F51_012925 [Rhizopus arrhizus]|uniref:Reverse transcriptase domain-containing protein n=1 Tax=Rhizopus oryzae TaxID=64495 RepID=A0A9P7C2U1_RHIOR|nr:hypothetical protein G6F51_012925 [Rhizopus arrhizus]